MPDLTKGVKATTVTAARGAVERLARQIPARELREPRTPVKRLIAEARRLEGRVKKDEPTLLARSAYRKDEGLLLGAATQLFVDASTALFEASAPNLPSRIARQRAAAEATLTAVWADLQYLAEENEDAALLKQVSELREGDSLDDTVTDLERTIPLLKRHAKGLGAVGSPGAAQLAKQLQSALTQLSAEQAENAAKDTYDTLKERRDRLGILLEAHLARLRRHGRKAFSSDPVKRGQYVDQSLPGRGPAKPPAPAPEG